MHLRRAKALRKSLLATTHAFHTVVYRFLSWTQTPSIYQMTGALRRSKQNARKADRKSAVMRDMEVKIAQLVGDNACVASHIAEVEACNSELRQQISICAAMWHEAVASNGQLSKNVRLLETRSLVIIKHLCTCSVWHRVHLT